MCHIIINTHYINTCLPAKKTNVSKRRFWNHSLHSNVQAVCWQRQNIICDLAQHQTRFLACDLSQVYADWPFAFLRHKRHDVCQGCVWNASLWYLGQHTSQHSLPILTFLVCFPTSAFQGSTTAVPAEKKGPNHPQRTCATNRKCSPVLFYPK